MNKYIYIELEKIGYNHAKSLEKMAKSLRDDVFPIVKKKNKLTGEEHGKNRFI